MLRSIISDDSRIIIKEYRSKGYISEELKESLLECTSKKKFIELYSSIFQLNNPEKIDMIWRRIRENWRGVDNESINTMLDQHDCFFLEKLLTKGGVMEVSLCMKHDVCKNDRYRRIVTGHLKDMEYIDIIVLARDVVYVLNLDFYKEVFPDG